MPAKDPAPAVPSELEELLGPGGSLSRALPGYEARAAQVEMAEKVSAALARGRALVIEAGTGTGKTLAYLLPAAKSGLRVVVSTATRTLQEQLAEKDVPLLRALGVQAKVVFLKGRQNYLCLLRKEQFEQNPTFAIAGEAVHYEAIARWAQSTQDGELSELRDLPENAAVFRELTSTSENCTGQKCPHYDACYVFRMRRRAAEADVVVVNHHLFFADLALRSSSAGDQGAAVLPRYDAVVFDEAHAVEEVATENFGVSVSSHRAAELGRDVLKALAQPRAMARPGARDLAQRLLHEGAGFFEAVQAARPADPEPQQRRGRSAFRASAPRAERWALSDAGLLPAEQERLALVELLRSLGAALSGEDASDEVQLLERRCSVLAADLGLFAAAGPGRVRVDRGADFDQRAEPGPMPAAPEQVRWAEARAGGLVLHASPLDVGRLLQDRLYDRIGPVVFTSATLAVGGDLGFFERRIGLADASGPLFPTDEAQLESPFDYETHAALYLPRGLPDPSDPTFVEAVANELRALVPITQGRAFALFTSLRNMRAVHGLLATELAAQGLRVLLQGERPRQELLRAFKERPSVLFASQSFWEGVDVPGEALQLVVIDKLPFASPTEPLHQARIERLRALGEDPFSSYQLPQAALALKQGFGRLIRTARDRGVVAVLDPRMTQRGYGRTFVSTLPRCRILRDRADVEGFWAAGAFPRPAG